ncbi:hypothetical protein BT96DRAFT_915612 [Gymnopus androsaceus JB14]|uniref:Uncharacterized protein n=1 Tax=Gymnopus androsaceus JB14 TaxID=1447944 RepID=A0A6A4I5X3_9AGAR|nr:hypothetical protein BT96DRAFT_915612 [Gymnopus androsaceus JB14]
MSLSTKSGKRTPGLPLVKNHVRLDANGPKFQIWIETYFTLMRILARVRFLVYSLANNGWFLHFFLPMRILGMKFG